MSSTTQRRSSLTMATAASVEFSTGKWCAYGKLVFLGHFFDYLASLFLCILGHIGFYLILPAHHIPYFLLLSNCFVHSCTSILFYAFSCSAFYLSLPLSSLHYFILFPLYFYYYYYYHFFFFFFFFFLLLNLSWTNITIQQRRQVCTLSPLASLLAPG